MTSFIDDEHNIMCRECDWPMLGIKDPRARHTCVYCGGESLVSERRQQEKIVLTGIMGRVTESERYAHFGEQS